jgi:hypothetical protein
MLQPDCTRVSCLYNRARPGKFLNALGLLPEGENMPDHRLPAILVFILLVPVGLAGLFKVIQSPNHAMYRTVDVVQLTGCGFCFGVAFMGVIFVLRGVRIRDSK